MKAFLILGGTLLMLLACKNDIAEIDALFEEVNTKIEVGTDIELLYSDSSGTKIRLTSPKLHRHLSRATPRDEFPNGLHVDFLDEDGRVESTLDADGGNRYDRTREIVVYGNVVIRNRNGEIMETSQLTWDEREQRAHTSRFVKIIRPDEEIYSNGFEATNNFNNYMLYSVRARVKAPKEGFTD